MAKAILESPSYQPSGKIIFDHRGIDLSQATLEDLKMIRKFHMENEEKIGDGKCAIVVESESNWNRLWS